MPPSSIGSSIRNVVLVKSLKTELRLLTTITNRTRKDPPTLNVLFILVVLRQIEKNSVLVMFMKNDEMVKVASPVASGPILTTLVVTLTLWTVTYPCFMALCARPCVTYVSFMVKIRYIRHPVGVSARGFAMN